MRIFPKLMTFFRSVQFAIKEANRTVLVTTCTVSIFLLIVLYLLLSHNRYYILASESGAYEVDRWTGNTWILHGATKTLQAEIQPQQSAKNKIETLPINDLSEVTGGEAKYDNGRFNIVLYNGSDWHISEVKFEISVKEKDKSIRWTHEYKISNISLSPLSTELYTVRVIDEKDYGAFNWRLIQARGYQKN
jgi:hypothetical protein